MEIDVAGVKRHHHHMRHHKYTTKKHSYLYSAVACGYSVGACLITRLNLPAYSAGRRRREEEYHRGAEENPASRGSTRKVSTSLHFRGKCHCRRLSPRGCGADWVGCSAIGSLECVTLFAGTDPTAAAVERCHCRLATTTVWTVVNISDLLPSLSPLSLSLSRAPLACIAHIANRE